MTLQRRKPKNDGAKEMEQNGWSRNESVNERKTEPNAKTGLGWEVRNCATAVEVAIKPDE